MAQKSAAPCRQLQHHALANCITQTTAGHRVHRSEGFRDYPLGRLRAEVEYANHAVAFMATHIGEHLGVRIQHLQGTTHQAGLGFAPAQQVAIEMQ